MVAHGVFTNCCIHVTTCGESCIMLSGSIPSLNCVPKHRCRLNADFSFSQGGSLVAPRTKSSKYVGSIIFEFRSKSASHTVCNMANASKADSTFSDSKLLVVARSMLGTASTTLGGPVPSGLFGAGGSRAGAGGNPGRGGEGVGTSSVSSCGS